MTLSENTRFLLLSGGFYTLIDADDYDRVTQLSWHLQTRKTRHRMYRYAKHEFRKEGRRTSTLLHIFIMNPPKGKVVDHINGDGLDNRKCNLRICSQGENSRNRRLNTNNTSGIPNVIRIGNAWNASFQAFEKRYSRSFKSPEAACKWVEAKKREMCGEFSPALFTRLDSSAALDLVPRKHHKNNTSGCTGVFWEASSKRWSVYRKWKGKTYRGGRFIDFEAARRKSEEIEQQINEIRLKGIYG